MAKKLNPVPTKIIIIAVVIAVIVIAGALIYYFQFAPQGPQRPAEFRLGAVLDRTGFGAPCAKAQEIGIMLAVKDINDKGGLWGTTPIKLIIRDGESTPEVQLRRFRELVEVEKVHAVVGTCHAGGAYALMKESLSLGVPFWPSPFTALEALKKDERPLWSFVSMGVPWSIGYAMAYYAIKILGAKKIYLSVYNYAFGWDIRDGAREAMKKYGGTEIMYEEFAPGTPDYSPIISRIIAAKPDALITSVGGADTVTFLKQAYALGLHDVTKIIIFGPHLWIKGVPPEALKGVYVVTASYHDLPAGLVDDETFRLMRAFTDRVIREAGEPPDPYTITNYVAVTTMIKVFEKLGKIENIKPEEFYRAVLEIGEIMTPRGPLKYTEIGLPAWKYYFFFGIGKGPEERTYIYDYLRITDVIGGEEVLPPRTLLGY
jgi:ABC-type branched-subunit amino acid transport system substrate-binding protein